MKKKVVEKNQKYCISVWVQTLILGTFITKIGVHVLARHVTEDLSNNTTYYCRNSVLLRGVFFN